MRLWSRWALVRCICYILLPLILMVAFIPRMPGKSYAGSLPAPTQGQCVLRDGLRRDVTALATTIGERSVRKPRALAAAAAYIEAAFSNAGYTVARQEYAVSRFKTNNPVVHNIEVEIPGTSSNEIVVVGAHYDTVSTPGADDNASGVAGLLAIARACTNMRPARTVRFVAFVNEEPPFFWKRDMGSLVYATRCKERKENVVAMFSLEMIGCYTNAPKSQKYPPPFSLLYPSTGNFIAFVGNISSRSLVRQSVGVFRNAVKFPSEGAAVPSWAPGVGFSDQWSFWKCGYPGVMVTDTAFCRYEQYHTYDDTPDKLDFDGMARVVEGMTAVVKDVAGKGVGAERSCRASAYRLPVVKEIEWWRARHHSISFTHAARAWGSAAGFGAGSSAVLTFHVELAIILVRLCYW